jgi:hypothetical protein
VAITGTSPAKNVDEMVVVVQYDHQHFIGPIMRLFGGAGLVTTPLRSISRMRVE